jgi:hypothetical protein
VVEFGAFGSSFFITKTIMQARRGEISSEKKNQTNPECPRFDAKMPTAIQRIR